MPDPSQRELTLAAIAPPLLLPLRTAEGDSPEDRAGAIYDSSGQLIAMADPLGRLARDDAKLVAAALVFAVNAYIRSSRPCPL